LAKLPAIFGALKGKTMVEPKDFPQNTFPPNGGKVRQA